MTSVLVELPLSRIVLPDHTQLPETDGSIVINYQEAPQSALLTDSLLPFLSSLYPDGHYAIGQDSGIYWRLTDPPLDGCKAPDWNLVLGVPPLLQGRMRRSYVMWQEIVPPLIVIEYVSGDGAEEHDRTPLKGKFWIYEKGIRAGYYAIFDAERDLLEVYELLGGAFRRLNPNERGHYPIAPLGLELGIWHGRFRNFELPWVRWWNAKGTLLPNNEERAEQEKQRAEQEKQRAEQEKQRAEQEKQRAEQEKQRADRLAERFRALGINPDAP